MVNVEHTRLTNSADVIKLGRNVLCPCSRELVILLSLQMLSVLLVQGCPLCCLLVFSFLANSMRLSWIFDCYNFWVFCSRTRQQSQMLRKEKNECNVPLFSLEQFANLLDAVKDSLPRMRMFRAKPRVSGTLLSRCVVLPSPSFENRLHFAVGPCSRFPL